MRSPTLLLMRMNAADTSASSAMADCTELTVVPRSFTTAEIDTFISDVSTTRTNIAIASRMERRWLPATSAGGLVASAAVIVVLPPCADRRARTASPVAPVRTSHRSEDGRELLHVVLIVLDRLPEEPLLVRGVLDPAHLGDDGEVAAELARHRAEPGTDLVQRHRPEALDRRGVHAVARVRRGVPLRLEAVHRRAPLAHGELL